MPAIEIFAIIDGNKEEKQLTDSPLYYYMHELRFVAGVLLYYWVVTQNQFTLQITCILCYTKKVVINCFTIGYEFRKGEQFANF